MNSPNAQATSHVPLVIVDLGGVLVRTHAGAQYTAMARLLEVPAHELAHAADDTGLSHALEQGLLSFAEFVAQLRELTASTAAVTVDVLRPAFCTVIEGLYTAMVEVLAPPAATNRLLFASNTSEPHWCHIRGLLAQTALKDVPACLSFRIGHCKPCPAFFDALAGIDDRVGLGAVFLDDRIDNVTGAARRGLTARRHTDTSSSIAWLRSLDINICPRKELHVPTIAVDLRANHDTGVARYGRSLLAAISPPLGEMKVLAVVRPGDASAAAAARAGGHRVIAIDGDHGFVRDNAELRRLLAAEAVDLYWSAHYTVDRHCPVPFAYTIHDLTRWRMPELSYTDATFLDRFGADELVRIRTELVDLAVHDPGDSYSSMFARYFIALNRDLAHRAARITTVSHATANDITNLLGVGSDRVDLVPCGVDTAVFRPRDTAEVNVVRRRFGLDGPYLMFVGLAHPNKRFVWLTEHLARAVPGFPLGSRLVAIGGHADRIPEVHRTLSDLDARDFVRYTGRVTDGELAALYTGASAWVTASLNEGNNLPPLEALACGSQVIATDIAPLRETIGPHAEFYPPLDATALVDAATRALWGRLDRRRSDYRAPTWHNSAKALRLSWQTSLQQAPLRRQG